MQDTPHSNEVSRLLAEGGPIDDWPMREDAALFAYQQTFQRHTTADWALIEGAQGESLQLLVERVPAEIGCQVILGMTALHTLDADQSAKILAIAMNELRPGYAWTILVAIADAFADAETSSLDLRAANVDRELQRTLRRLTSLDLPEADHSALQRIQTIVGK
ncbi:MAG: hypothetical protein M9890_10930 [Thermomicrobiales bacterium]|nr:hypothetical protein [Thermomicrobiales bacterium]